MADGGGGLRLVPHAADYRVRRGETRVDGLDGHLTVEARVEREVDFAHPADRDKRNDFEAAELSADERGRAVGYDREAVLNSRFRQEVARPLACRDERFDFVAQLLVSAARV